MDYSKLVDSLTPDMIQRLSEAVETGKWPDGNPLSAEHKESCIQAIMLYQARYSADEEQPFTVTKDGELVTGKKVRSEFNGVSSNEREEQIIIKTKPAN